MKRGQTGLIRQYIPKGTDMGKVTNNKRTASIQKTEGKGGTKSLGLSLGILPLNAWMLSV